MKNKLRLVFVTLLLAVSGVGCGASPSVEVQPNPYEEMVPDVTDESTTKEQSVLDEEVIKKEQSVLDEEAAPQEQSVLDEEAAPKEQAVLDEEAAPKEQSVLDEETVSEEDAFVSEALSSLTFVDLARYQFGFSSGAGAWSEDFTIEKDGYFTGIYYDANMGSTGEGYDNGTIYSSSYSGHFTKLTQINEYTYEMKLADISYKNPIDTEEIIDNTRYIYTASYCLGGEDTFTIYLPGTPLEELSEETYIWLSGMNESDTQLTMYAIVDKRNGYGMYSYDRPKPCKESYDYYGEKLSEAVTTAEMVEYSARRYEFSDECLNYIWNLIRYHVAEQSYQEILTKQRAWIVEKEEKAKEVSAEYEGGSFALVSYYDVLAELTMTRCEELIEYLK